MQESVSRAIPHRGITKKIIVLGEDIARASRFVVFAFDPQTKAELPLGHVPSKDNSSVIQFQGNAFL